MATTKFDKIIEAIGDLVKPVQEEIQKEEENNSCVRELYMVKTKLEEAALWLGRASFIAEDPISLPEEGFEEVGEMQQPDPEENA